MDQDAFNLGLVAIIGLIAMAQVITCSTLNDQAHEFELHEVEHQLVECIERGRRRCD